MLKLTQTFIVTDGTIGRISEMRRVFEDDKVYRAIFNSERLRADSRHILLCYKIERRLRKITNDIIQKGAKKYEFATRARYLIWALSCQGVLNSPRADLETLSQEEGRSLVVSANYTDYLSKLATTKIAPVLLDLMADKDYAQQVAEEKLGFLRADAAFDKSMSIAYKKWKWVKKKLA